MPGGMEPLLHPPSSVDNIALEDADNLEYKASDKTPAKCAFGCNSSLFLGISLVFVFVGLYMGIRNNVVDDSGDATPP